MNTNTRFTIYALPSSVVARSNVKVCFISLKKRSLLFSAKKNMNTNNNIFDEDREDENMDEDELLRQQQNTWTMRIEHDGSARRDVHPPPPRLIPLSSISKEGIEASEIRMKMMKYEADTTKPFSPPPQRNNGMMGVAVQSVSKSVGTQTTTDDVDDEEMFDTDGAEQRFDVSWIAQRRKRAAEEEAEGNEDGEDDENFGRR